MIFPNICSAWYSERVFVSSETASSEHAHQDGCDLAAATCRRILLLRLETWLAAVALLLLFIVRHEPIDAPGRENLRYGSSINRGLSPRPSTSSTSIDRTGARRRSVGLPGFRIQV